ncbi:VOC family protein [Streptomyces sp. NPDC001914]|uniref:VOC family protein n=1 Tax=Streptomyces sp. NPDC001914 TaxID=3364623 RepID=UPI0036A0192B
MINNIQAMIANVRVGDLEQAIPLYKELAGDPEVLRFPYKDFQLALVGPFLLVSGPHDENIAQNATVLVDSLDAVLAALEKAGANIIDAPTEVPNGTRLVAQHPDGSVFEYLQPRT